MQRNHREVVILKPTSVFLSFLSVQAQGIELPTIQLLQTDTTAYTIARQDGDEETLDEIERHFSTMFRYEINRWLGDKARNSIEGSFLDFLCCFKFEMHSQAILREPTIEKGHQLLCIKPRPALLKWLKASADSQDEFSDVIERVTLTQLCENSTVVVKNFPELSEIKEFISNNFLSIYKIEMHRMCDKTEQWPEVVTIDQFSQYFAVEIHSQLIHLS